MRVLICGSRSWTASLCGSMMDARMRELDPEDIIIEGEAPGADKMARQIAEYLGLTVIGYPANWKRYGKSAGPIRNKFMFNDAKPDLVLAFHDFIEMSTGTAHMMAFARKAGTPVEHWSVRGKVE